MSATCYVIGHRNPDTDSIAAAMAYAALRRRLGESHVVAAMAGEPNPQTSWILQRLGLQAPLLLADVHPKVRDTLNRTPVTVASATTAYEAIALFQRSGVRVLPVLADDGKPCGTLSLLRLSETYLLPDRERQREIVTTLPALARALEGRFLSGGAGEEARTLRLFVGAMQAETFRERIAPYPAGELLVVTGDRADIQRAAIAAGVAVLILSGGAAPAPELLELAAQRGVSVLSTPHDSAAAAWLARLSTPVGLIAEASFTTIGIGEPLSHLRQKLLSAKEPAILALEEDGTLAGVATKSSLLAPLPYSLILVDHNELGQAVPGAEAVEIREVIDHHKLGNSHTIAPIPFCTAPVGSTCTLVAGRYRDCGLDPEPAIAALLLAGILSDTVLLKSPTTTAVDRAAVDYLARLAALDSDAFGREIFAACSSLRNYPSPARIVDADFKHFSHDGRTIGVGQVEVVGFDEFYSLKESLLAELALRKERDRLFIAGLMVTDIGSETTLFLVEGHTRIAHVMEYPQLEPHLYELRNVLSRKKQMVPHLLKILARV